MKTFKVGRKSRLFLSYEIQPKKQFPTHRLIEAVLFFMPIKNSIFAPKFYKTIIQLRALAFNQKKSITVRNEVG